MSRPAVLSDDLSFLHVVGERIKVVGGAMDVGKILGWRGVEHLGKGWAGSGPMWLNETTRQVRTAGERILKTVVFLKVRNDISCYFFTACSV